MIPISAVIITYNEERNIGRCLESLQELVEEIIVLDSFSTDKTKEICNSFKNVKFKEREWEGYSSSKNFANKLANNNWILSIDADEALSNELKNSIKQINLTEKNNFYSFNRLTNYCGTWVKYGGWYPDRKIRIFNRETSKWEGDIHENLTNTSDSKATHLKGDCLHYSYYTIEEHWNQTKKFSVQTAKMLYNQKKKASLIKRYFSPLFKFIKDYLLKLGFLHGLVGWKICSISAYATYLKYKTLNDLNKHNYEIPSNNKSNNSYK
jgi:(heptosyl)LPS beta-1,4-glucosyltransferase